MNVVFLHGFCEHKSMWTDTMHALGDNWKLHAFDMCGFGTNGNTAETMRDYASDVFAQMDEAHIEKAIVLGHSMGGYVALEMLSTNPDRILGLGLIHSNAAADDDARKQARQKQIEFLQKHPTRPFLKPFSEQLLGRSNRNSLLTDRTWELVKDAQAPAIINALKAMMVRNDHRDLIRHTNKPILWLLGVEDEFISLDMVLHQVSNTNAAKLRILDDAGHLGTWESPEQTVDTIASYIRWVLS